MHNTEIMSLKLNMYCIVHRLGVTTYVLENALFSRFFVSIVRNVYQSFFDIFFGWLECVGPSFLLMLPIFVFLRDVWI